MGVRAACLRAWRLVWAGLHRIGAALAAAGAARVRWQWHALDHREGEDEP